MHSLDLGLGALLGYRSGRGDSSPGFASANGGSARLSRLPNVSGAIDVGVGGHIAVFGVPLFVQGRSAVSGPQGTLLNLGVYLPLPLDAAVEFTVVPTVTWANGRGMRAFYGLTANKPQLTASPRTVLLPGGRTRRWKSRATGSWQRAAAARVGCVPAAARQCRRKPVDSEQKPGERVAWNL